MTSDKVEQRRGIRFTYFCEVECDALAQLSFNRITNLSTTGAWINTLNPPDEGSILKLRFHVGSVDVRTQAKVIRRLPGEGMAVAFQDLSPPYREAIKALSGGTSAEGEQDHQLRLEQIMTTEVVTVGMDETIETIKELFERSHFHHVLVVEEEEGTLVGVVSDRDLLKAVSPFISTLAERSQDLRTLDRRVHQIMSRRVITACKNHTVTQASILMLANNISCLPVVSDQGTIQGIVTSKDMLKWLVKQLQE